MEIMYKNMLETKSSLRSKIPIVSSLSQTANKVEVMNDLLWKNAILHMSKKLEKELKQKSCNFEIIREDRKVVIDLDEDTFSDYFFNIMPHFESYQEYKEISNKAINQAKGITGRVKSLLRKVNNTHYKKAMSEFQEAKEDINSNILKHPLYSRNGYWLYSFAMIETVVPKWDEKTKIENTILNKNEVDKDE